MYKIYINKTLIELRSARPQKALAQDELHTLYAGRVKHLLNIIDMAEKGGQYQKVTIYHPNYAKLKSDFLGLFSIVEAAGGLVVNPLNEILFIYRRGHWDLPKGKLEKREKKKDAAVREVQEETGVQNITLHGKICVTNHTYRNRSGKRLIKKSHWYHMTAPRIALTPQIEEDITQAEWMTVEHFFSERRPVFSSILRVLKKYRKMMRSSNLSV